MKTPTLSPLQQLRRAINLVGESQLKVKWSEESPLSAVIRDDQIVVVLSVNRRVTIRGGTKITHMGTRGLVYRPRGSTPGWYLEQELVVVNKLDDPILEMSYGVLKENEYLDRKLHEDMCYRPGTSSFPMDGPMTRL